MPKYVTSDYQGLFRKVARMRIVSTPWNWGTKFNKRYLLKTWIDTNFRWKARPRSRNASQHSWTRIAPGERRWSGTCRFTLDRDGTVRQKCRSSKNNTITRLICGALAALFLNFCSTFIRTSISSRKSFSKRGTCFKAAPASHCRHARTRIPIMKANPKRSTW